MLRSFEDLASDSPVYNQYDGVTFIGGNNTNPDGSHPITIFQPASGTISSSNAVRSNIRSSCEFCGTSLTLRFDEPQYRVSLSTGLAISYPYAPLTMLLLGYDGDPENSASRVVVQSVAPCLGTMPTPVTMPLAIFDVAARIRYAQLWLVRCSDPLTPKLGPNQQTLVLDNLLYDGPVSAPPQETDPPVITVTSPSNGATVTGSIPGALYLPVEATITETALAGLTAQLNGRIAIPMHYRQTGPLTYEAAASLDNTDGLVSGANTLTITAVDLDRPAQTTTVSVNFIYRVKPIPPISELDIWPIAFQVTQGIDVGPLQFRNTDLSGDSSGYLYRVNAPQAGNPGLVTSKDILIRIYGGATGTTSSVPNVPAMASVKYADCTSNCVPASGGQLIPLETPTKDRREGITVAPIESEVNHLNRDASQLGSTWNFLIPAAEVTRDLVVTVFINEGRYNDFPTQPSIEECRSGIVFTCTGNNRLELRLHLEPQPRIIVHPIYLHVTGTNNGHSYNNVAPSIAQVDRIFTYLNKLYPSRVIRGLRFDRTVSPSDDKESVLDVIKHFWSSDSNAFFLGIFPGDQERNPRDFAANDVGGIGRLGGRGAWAQANNVFAAAHELGHNVGLKHFSCAHNEESGGDCEPMYFEFRHGGLGGYGTDIANWYVISPGDLDTDHHAHDFMSYGTENKWVSRLTYERLRTHPGVDSFSVSRAMQRSTAAIPTLLVRGQINTAGVATLNPVYQATAQLPPPQPPDTAADPAEVYTLQGFDLSGNTLFVHNFTPHPLMDANESLLDFEELVPVVANLDRLVVLKEAQILGELTNTASGQPPTVGLSAPIAGNTWPVGIPQTVRWVAQSPTGLPLVAQVQYSPDSGATRITLARDVTGNEFTVNPDELPGSTQGYIIVQVSDGLNSVETAAGPLTVANKPPAVHIISPVSGSTVVTHLPISLQGDAYDPEQALDGLTFRWSSTRDGLLGIDQNLVVSELSAGWHRLTLTVTDRQGLVGETSVDIQVQAGYKLFLPLIRHN